MVNEARAINLGNIQRKKDINEVSQLGKWLAQRLGTPILWVCSQKAVEGTPAKRARAHRKLLRSVKTDLEVMRQKEQVIS